MNSYVVSCLEKVKQSKHTDVEIAVKLIVSMYLEKAYGRVPVVELQYCIMKSGVAARCVSVV